MDHDGWTMMIHEVAGDVWLQYPVTTYSQVWKTREQSAPTFH